MEGDDMKTRLGCCKRWQPAELVLLKELNRGGVPFTHMVISDRTSHAIGVKARQLGMRSSLRWSVAEEQTLRKLVSAGTLSRHQTIELRGVTRSAWSMRAKAVRLRLVTPRPSRQQWTTTEQALLRQLSQLGYTPRVIKSKGFFGSGRRKQNGSVLPERTANAIAKMAQRLKLINGWRSLKLSRAKRRCTKEFSQALDQFLLGPGKAMPSRLIAKAFDISGSTVRAHRVKLGCRHTWQQAMSLPDSYLKSPASAARRSLAVKKSWTARRAKQSSPLN